MKKTKLDLLLIEDNPGDAELVQEYLLESQIHSIQVTHCVRISEALKHLKNGKHIDIILSDVGLPDTTGIDTFRKLHDVANTIPLVFMTGTIPDEEAAIQALKEGAQDYLVKGQFTPDLLLRSIRYAIERKKSEEELKEQKLQLQTLTENIPDIITRHDKKFRYVYVNPAITRVTDIPAENFINKTYQELEFPEEMCVFFDMQLEKAFRLKESFNIEYSFSSVTPERVMNSTLVPEFDDKGEMVTVLVITRDITDRKKLERQKDDFIGIASHELKTPVTSVKAYTQVLHQIFVRKGDARSAELLTKMDGQLNKLTTLIADLLDVTKIQGGKLQFNDSYFDFNELVNEIVVEIQRTTERHKLVTELTKTKTVYGDRDRIGQVLTNFLTNAIKYSPQSKKIIVKTESDKTAVTLSVQDFGLGISKDKQEKVFERFYRVSADKAETIPGMGLGLYISSEIIKRQGGKIWVESIEGKGSTFFFQLLIAKNKTKHQRNSLAGEGEKY